MFYILVLPSLALSVTMIFYLLRLKKHDLVLYSFCQIRRDAIALIDKRGLETNRAAYHSLRNLLNGLNAMVHDYEGCKKQIFNLRKLVALLKDYKQMSRQVEKIKIPDDPEIANLHLRFRRAIVRAFLAYTPLIKSEIAAWLFFKLVSFFADCGIKSLKRVAENLRWLVDEISNTQDNHNGKPLIA